MANDVHEVFRYEVRSYECAPNGCATLANICNYLQEAASVNAEHLGFSKVNFDSAGMNITWVMTRMRLTVARYPKWGEGISILTFPRPPRRIVAYRDFIATGADGAEILRATSEWMMIDMTSRRPVPIPDVVMDKGNDVREPVHGEGAFTARLRWPQDAAPQRTFETLALKSDIDLNAHVNNARYVAWLMEMAESGRHCKDLEIVFRSETVAGEKVLGEAVETGDGSTMMRLKSPSGAEHVVARAIFHD